jgi:hypothetical protein
VFGIDIDDARLVAIRAHDVDLLDADVARLRAATCCGDWYKVGYSTDSRSEIRDLFGGELMDQESTAVLVVAHQTAATLTLLEAVRERARDGPSRFHLLVPRRRRRKEKVANPKEIGVQEAREVLRNALPRLSEAAGTEVTGEIGDLDPLIAIQVALNGRHYDEIIVSTLPLGVSRWLEVDLVSKTRQFGLPVDHVLGKDHRLAGAANH